MRLSEVPTRLEQELLVGLRLEVLQGAGLEGDLETDRAPVNCHPVTVQEGPGLLGLEVLYQDSGQVPAEIT